MCCLLNVSEKKRRDGANGLIEEPITIREAADRLGVSERTLRRFFQADEQAAKLVAISRQVGGRCRVVRLVPLAVIEELQEVFQSRKMAGRGEHDQQAEQAAEQQAGNRQAGGNHEAGGEASRADMEIGPRALIMVYERLLAEKDARIEELTAALDHERQQSKRAFGLVALSGPVEHRTGLMQRLRCWVKGGGGNGGS